MLKKKYAKIERASNFELLRLISMYFILLYHLISFFITKVDDNPLYKGLYIPLHVGVICFVLISGYFHIKPSMRGVVRLIAPIVVYYIPLSFVEYISGMGGVKTLLFFSKSPYWFIRTYLYLFLMAPILNSYMVNNKRRVYLMLVLGFISIYMGTIQEPSLKDGKNLVLFMFLYVLGDCLRHFEDALKVIRTHYLWLMYLLFNVLVVTVFYLQPNGVIGKAIWILNYPYCSPGLLVNAIMLFVIVGRIKIKSRVINYLSSSVLSVYIIHHQPLILYSIIGPVVLMIYDYFNYSIPMLLSVCCFAFLLLICCIGIDKIISPLWNVLLRKTSTMEIRMKEYLCKIG